MGLPNFFLVAFVAIPVDPPVITYVNESSTLSLLCSKVITASALAVKQKWLNPNQNIVSSFAKYTLALVNRTNAGLYTCVTTILLSNLTGQTVNTTTQVVVNCKPHHAW